MQPAIENNRNYRLPERSPVNTIEHDRGMSKESHKKKKEDNTYSLINDTIVIASKIIIAIIIGHGSNDVIITIATNSNCLYTAMGLQHFRNYDRWRPSGAPLSVCTRHYCAPGNLPRRENPSGAMTGEVTMTNGRFHRLNKYRRTRDICARLSS